MKINIDKPAYDPDQLDVEVLKWYAHIDPRKIEEELNTLDGAYEPGLTNQSFRISSRLQELADLGLGLWIKWEYTAFPAEEGFIYDFGRGSDVCSVKQVGKFGLTNVAYSDIKQIALKLPTTKMKI